MLPHGLAARGHKMIYEPKFLRFFQARFEAAPQEAGAMHRMVHGGASPGPTRPQGMLSCGRRPRYATGISRQTRKRRPQSRLLPS
jgi:hypothetical protein